MAFRNGGRPLRLASFELAKGRSEDDRAFISTVSLLIIPMVALYVSAGWGILKWKNWGRALALGLNWINVLAAAARIARLEIEGGVSVVASCLALWWLSMPAVKLMFREMSKSPSPKNRTLNPGV